MFEEEKKRFINSIIRKIVTKQEYKFSLLELLVVYEIKKNSYELLN